MTGLVFWREGVMLWRPRACIMRNLDSSFQKESFTTHCKRKAAVVTSCSSLIQQVIHQSCELIIFQVGKGSLTLPPLSLMHTSRSTRVALS